MGTSEQDIQNVLLLCFSEILIIELFTRYLFSERLISKKLLVKLKLLEARIKLLLHTVVSLSGCPID